MFIKIELKNKLNASRGAYGQHKKKKPLISGAFSLRWALLDGEMVGRREFNSLSNL